MDYQLKLSNCKWISTIITLNKELLLREKCDRGLLDSTLDNLYFDQISVILP